MNPITEYAVIAGVGLALCVSCWLGGSFHGRHVAELACANANTAAIAEGVDKWKAAADAQSKADHATREAETKRASEAADKAQAVADRFASMKLAIVKLPPAAACKLSPAWVDAFNGAR